MAYTTEQIRSVALCGHGGAGKTALCEAMLYQMGVVNRMGRIADGTTVSDYDKAEIERRMSLKISLVNGDWEGHHVNVLDTPGYADFIAESKAALRVADAAVIVVDAVGGIEIGTERVWGFAAGYSVPRFIYINKMDRAEADPDGVLEVARERFGRKAVPVQLPVDSGEGFHQLVDLATMRLLTYRDGKASQAEVPAELQTRSRELREQLVEAVAETDEQLMEKYFSEGELLPADLQAGLRKAVLHLDLFPVLYGDAFSAVGTDRLLTALAQYAPAPAESPGLRFTGKNDQPVTLEGRPDVPLASFVFKVIAEQHVGELTLLRLYSGTLQPGAEVLNSSQGSNERIGQMFHLNGHQRIEVEGAVAGDIVALVKLKDTHTGNTLCLRSNAVVLPGIEFPEPLICVAIEAKEKGGEDRIATGLSQLHEEDPSFVFRHDPEVHQSLLFAQGELHLSTLLQRLRERYHAEVETQSPRIPYKETVRGAGEGHHRHKKQTGGRGQFGEVFLRVAARGRGEGFEFDNEVVGGNIPSNFIPAVEKGIVETLEEGPLAGCKVVDVAAVVYDGKYHAVDSDEVSFKLAASQAFKDAFLKAKPVLLEPIYSITVTVPEEFMGDVMGDLTKRRGRISGMDADGPFQIIRAEAPLAELDRYATTLRSMTQGKGLHTQRFERYEEVPGDIMARVMEETRRARESA
ncbi:MAG: elongation factor G [Candidatus Latescibacterota bacterium]